MHTLNMYLSVSDARAAIAFYKEVFGAVESGPMIVDADGRIGHAELRIGDTVLMYPVAVADQPYG